MDTYLCHAMKMSEDPLYIGKLVGLLGRFYLAMHYWYQFLR